MKILETDRLILRNWEERDRQAFFRLNSDEQVMRFFGFRRDRAEADAFMDRLRVENEERGFGFCAVEERRSGTTVGICGIHHTPNVPIYPEGVIEAGWRFIPEIWGHGYATESAAVWLAEAFIARDTPEIVAFAVWSNEASIAVMRRLGMSHVEGGDFDHPAVPDERPELKRHVLYRISRKAWLARHS